MSAAKTFFLGLAIYLQATAYFATVEVRGQEPKLPVPPSNQSRLEITLGDRKITLISYHADLKLSLGKGGRSVNVTDVRRGGQVRIRVGKLQGMLRATEGRPQIDKDGLAFTRIAAGLIAVQRLPQPGDNIGLYGPYTPPAKPTGKAAANGRYLEAHGGHLTSVAFSPDSRLAVSAGWDGRVVVWDVETGRQLRREEYGGAVFAAALTPDGRHVVSARGSEIRFWSVENGEIVRRFSMPGRVHALAVSPDGKFLLAGGDNPASLAFGVKRAVYLWDIESGEARLFEPPMEIVQCLAFSSDGRLVLCTGSYYSNSDTPIEALALVWDLQSGETMLSVESPRATGLSQASFSPDGRSILMRDFFPNTGLALWDVRTGKIARRIPSTRPPQFVAFLPHGRHALSVIGSIKNGVRTSVFKLWDLEKGHIAREFPGPQQHVTCMAVSPDGHYVLSGGYDGTLWLRRLPEPPRDAEDLPRQVQCFVHDAGVFAAAFSPDGRRVLSGGSDLSVRLWDVKSGQELHKFQGTGGHHVVRDLAFSRDGRYALLGGGQQPDDRNLTLWDVDAWQEIRHLVGHEQTIRCVAFSPDGRHVLTGDLRGKVRYWDATSGRETTLYEPPTRPARCVAFSPDGRLAVYAGGNDQPVRVWEVDSGRDTCLLEGHRHPVVEAAFSSDGTKVFTGSEDGTIRVWELKTGEQLRSMIIPQETTCLAFSQDGRRALSGGRSGTVHLWDVYTGEELATLQGHTDRVACTAFSPQGDYALSAGFDRTVRVWRLPPIGPKK